MLVESLKYIHPYIVGLNFTSYFLLFNKLDGFPNGAVGRESAYDAGDTEDMDFSHVWVRKIP